VDPVLLYNAHKVRATKGQFSSPMYDLRTWGEVIPVYSYRGPCRVCSSELLLRPAEYYAACKPKVEVCNSDQLRGWSTSCEHLDHHVSLFDTPKRCQAKHR
jgi:hypothetical protein